MRFGGRILTATRGWTVGTVQSIDREFIMLRVQRPEGQTEEQIPFDVISELQVSRGIGTVGEAKRRGVRRGAIVGAGFGAGVSALTYLYDRNDSPDPQCTGVCSALESSAVNTVRNVAVAGGLGALAGMLIGRRALEIWEPTAKPRLDLRSRDGGGTAVSLFLRAVARGRHL